MLKNRYILREKCLQAFAKMEQNLFLMLKILKE